MSSEDHRQDDQKNEAADPVDPGVRPGADLDAVLPRPVAAQAHLLVAGLRLRRGRGLSIGRALRVRLVDYLRAEAKFPDLESLKRQIALDCREARARLVLAAAS